MYLCTPYVHISVYRLPASDSGLAIISQIAAAACLPSSTLSSRIISTSRWLLLFLLMRYQIPCHTSDACFMSSCSVGWLARLFSDCPVTHTLLRVALSLFARNSRRVLCDPTQSISPSIHPGPRYILPRRTGMPGDMSLLQRHGLPPMSSCGARMSCADKKQPSWRVAITCTLWHWSTQVSLGRYLLS